MVGDSHWPAIEGSSESQNPDQTSCNPSCVRAEQIRPTFNQPFLDQGIQG